MQNPHSNNQDTPLTTNPQEPKQQKQPNTKQNHSEHNHDQLDSDCEGCQAEKRQNEKLVDFYQRLDKISTKVKKFKSNKNAELKEVSHMQNSIQHETKELIIPQILQQKLKQLDSKINIPELPSVSQIKEFSSKEIGFELAAALIQRQMKYKNQNKKLQERINQLLAQKKKKQQIESKISNSSFFNPPRNDFTPDLQTQMSPQSEIKDSLDDFKSNKKINRKQKDDASFWDIDNTATSNGFKYQQTTFFETKKRNHPSGPDKTKLSTHKQFEAQLNQTELGIPQTEKKKNPYNTEQGYGLNLWLYQFKAEDIDEKLQNSWISDKNKSQLSQRYSNRANRKPNEANKSPRISNVNKTSIIQKNLASDYSPLIQNKRKNY